MALDKKFDFISTLGGDVLVVQECSQKSIDRIKEYEGYSAFWYGENKNKGLGIIARSPWKITEPRWRNKSHFVLSQAKKQNHLSQDRALVPWFNMCAFR
jgi:hypothetical protein